jgi:hypothetical protein
VICGFTILYLAITGKFRFYFYPQEITKEVCKEFKFDMNVRDTNKERRYLNFREA